MVPPRGVIDRHGYIRQIIPPALAQGHRLPPPRLAPNVKLAQVNLNRPNFVPPPKNVPADHRHYSPGPARGAAAGTGSAGHGVAHQGHHAPDPPNDPADSEAAAQAAVCAGQSPAVYPGNRDPAGRLSLDPGQVQPGVPANRGRSSLAPSPNRGSSNQAPRPSPDRCSRAFRPNRGQVQPGRPAPNRGSSNQGVPAKPGQATTRCSKAKPGQRSAPGAPGRRRSSDSRRSEPRQLQGRPGPAQPAVQPQRPQTSGSAASNRGPSHSL